MAIAALLMPIAAFFAVGGIDGLLTGLQTVSTPEQLSFSAGNTGLFALGIIIGGLSIGLGTYGQPHLMSRIMALRDKSAMRTARWLTIIWYLVVFLGMWFVGIVGHVLHHGLANSEQIFFVMLDGLFPTVVAAILLAAILSAIMSTADSQLLAAAAAIAHDLGLGGEDKKRVLMSWRRISLMPCESLSVVICRVRESPRQVALAIL